MRERTRAGPRGGVVLTVALVAAIAVGAFAVIAVTAGAGIGIDDLLSLDATSQDAERLRAVGTGIYVLATVGAFLEVGTPVGILTPMELVVPVAGAAAATGQVHLGLLMLLVWGGCAAGDSCGYATGATLGRGGSFTFASERKGYRRVVDRLGRNDVAVVLTGRFVPYARTLTPLAAGSLGMPYRRFLAASIVGSGVWSVVLCGLGFVLYESLERIGQVLGYASLAVLTTIIVVVAVSWRRGRIRRRAVAALPGERAPEAAVGRPNGSGAAGPTCR